LSISFFAQLVDATEAGFTVRLEDNGEKLTEEVVKLLAIMGVHVALCTAMIPIIHTAGAYLAPFSLLVFATTGAFAGDILTA